MLAGWKNLSHVRKLARSSAWLRSRRGRAPRPCRYGRRPGWRRKRESAASGPRKRYLGRASRI